MNYSIKAILTNKLIYISIILWGIVQYFIFKQNGIVTNLEAEKYIFNANSIIEKGSFNLEYLSYSTYIIFLALLFKIGLGYKSVIFVQLALNGLATFKLFQITEKISGKRVVAYIATFFFISCYQIQVWNFHLYTDSFFLSILIIFIDSLINFNYNKWRSFTIITLLFILLLFSRPVGILFLIPATIYLTFKYQSNFKPKKLSYSIILFISCSTLLLAGNIFLYRNDLSFSDLIKSIYSNSIICGWDTDLIIPQEDNSNGILFNIKKMIIKIGYYYGMVRPYYSNTHNLILTTFYPVYVFSLIGSFTIFKQKEYKYLMLSIISLFSLLITATCINWHGRFILPILPFIIILGAIGFNEIIQKLFKAQQ